IQAIAPFKITKAEVVVLSGYQKTDSYPMTQTDAFSFTTTIPKNKIYNQTFKYYVVIHSDDKSVTFPESNLGHPADWDFLAKFPYETEVVNADNSLVLFDACDKSTKFLWPNLWSVLNYKIETVAYKSSLKKDLRIYAEHLKINIPDLTFKILVPDVVKNDASALKNVTNLIVSGSSGNKVSQKIQVALQLKNGKVFGKNITLTSQKQEVGIALKDFVEVPLILLPRPYPDFQPYYFQSKSTNSFDVSEIEAVQISMGPGLTTDELNQNQELILDTIKLQ
ncbi:MAG TPA: hypothetical protein DDZ41_01880, partial [Flavobacterium sp.]|nr:hypothetical protein [Flavobacterium sp.]